MAEISRKKALRLWGIICKRNSPMPEPEIKTGGSRGNRVLKAKDMRDKRRFPPKKWWEIAEWEEFCSPTVKPNPQTTEEIQCQCFARALVRWERIKKDA